jgi:transcriptional regulator with XRE-family HTH domain
MDSAGQRIARARKRRGLSQVALAGLVGRSESWLSQVERGKRAIDSHLVLSRLAEVLRVDIADIVEYSGDEASRPYPYAGQIERAMARGFYSAEGTQLTHLDNLREMARSAYKQYQAAQYDAVGRLLPRLIADAEMAGRTYGLARPDICEIRALAYDTAAALLNRIGEPGLAWTAADRAMSAAEYSGEPLLGAFGAYRLAYVLTARQHAREAIELAMGASAVIERVMRSPSPEQLSVYGGLHFAAAMAAAAVYDHATASALIAKARVIAEQLGNANLMGTAFGPVNVAIHAVAVSLMAGDARTAVEIGEGLDATEIPSGLVGRRTQAHLDLARAYALRRQDAAAVNVLLAAERLSPQLVRYDVKTREVLTELLRREHRASTPELRPLAQRAGVA